MIIQVSEEVFACHHRLCAPPPVGKGGSSRGGPSGARAWARRTGIQMAKKRSDSLTTAQKHPASDNAPGPTKAGQALTAKYGSRGAGKAPRIQSETEIKKGGTRKIPGMGSHSQMGRYKNGQYWVKPTNGTGRVPLAAKTISKAMDEALRLGR